MESRSTFKLNERFVNILDPKDQDAYLDIIWSLIELSYSSIGGYSIPKERLIDETNLWKLVKRNGIIVAGQLFRDELGHKMVCGFSNGTPEGKSEFKSMIIDILERNKGWMEASGAVERIIWKVMTPMTNDKAVIVLKMLNKKALSISDDGYHYTRMIAGRPLIKVMFGIPETNV
jgi:hypothetical protein